MSKFGRKQRQAPEGFDIIEPTIIALENELKDRINEPHEGLRKNESQWPVHQINWQKSRYVYDMYYTYGKISKQVYEYCIENKVVDAALIAKWKKPGYETLCSTYVINPRNYKFGTVSICRVPAKDRPKGQIIEDPMTGCRGCGAGCDQNIFGNKYGIYLAALQIAREEKKRRALEQAEARARADDESNNDDDNDDDFSRSDGGGGDDDSIDDEVAERLKRLQESSNININNNNNNNNNNSNNSNNNSSNRNSNVDGANNNDDDSDDDDDVGPTLGGSSGGGSDEHPTKRSRQ